MEIVYAFVIVALFFTFAPLMQSKKRADSQKILAKKLEEAGFETAIVISAGEMALYIDEKNSKWFWRKNRLDVLPVVYDNEMLASFEFLENGNIVARADAGKTPGGGMFEKSSEKSKTKNAETIVSFDLLIRIKGSRYNEIVVNFLESSMSRRSREYKKVLQSAKDIGMALAKIQGSRQD